MLSDDGCVALVFDKLKQLIIVNVHLLAIIHECLSFFIRVDDILESKRECFVVTLEVHVADQREDLIHLFIFLLKELLFLIFVHNVNSSLEVSDLLLVSDFSRFINLR